MTFVRNHAEGILACDFFVTVTASFRVLYVFVVMEVGTRRIAHVNVTALEHSQNAIPSAPGECILRTVNREHSA
jgi:hypothetical protein